MSAASQFNNFDAAVVVQVLLTAFLVIALLGGGMLILNLGLLSKREEDRIGGPNPSDVGILKNERFPGAPINRYVLPALDDEDGKVVSENITERQDPSIAEVERQVREDREKEGGRAA